MPGVQPPTQTASASFARHGACALAQAALWRTIAAPAHDPSALFDQARELAERTGDPVVTAEVEMRRGLACIARGELQRAPNHLEVAHELLQTECPGQPWLLTRVRMYLGHAWMRSGKYGRLTQNAEPWLAEARAKHDRYAVAALSGFGAASYRFLLKDDPAAVLAELDSAMAPWPEEPFSDNHFGAFSARMSALLVHGGGEALAWLQVNRLRFERSLLMRAPTPRSILTALRAYLEGLITGGDSGRAKCEAGVAWLRSEGSVNPGRHLRELVPGLDLLASRVRG